MRDQWVMYEWLAIQETVPGTSGDGQFFGWATPAGGSTVLVNHWNNLNFNASSGDPNAFNIVKFIPYYGGGGGNAPSNQYLYVSRMRVSGHS